MISQQTLKSRRRGFFAPSLLSMMVVAFGFAAGAQEGVHAEGGPNHDATIHVSGEGSALAVPDIMRLGVGFEARERDTRRANDLVARAVQAALERLAEAGVEARDVRTRRIGLEPIYSGRQGSLGSMVIDGWRAHASLQVVLRNAALFSDVHAAMVDVGASGIEGPSFDLSDRETLQTEARKAAVRDARRKADDIAEAAGLRIIGVEQISDSGGGGRSPYMRAEMATMSSDSASMPIALGEETVSMSVSASFRARAVSDHADLGGVDSVSGPND